MNKASEKRQHYMTNNLEKKADYMHKLEQTLLQKEEMKEKRLYDVMNKVVLKHHNKMKKFAKDEKMEKEKRIYNIEKSKENDLLLKQKLKALEGERLEKAQQLKKKFDRIDNN